MRRETAHAAAPIPSLLGVGLRAPHYRAVLQGLPPLGWFEVHSENYFGAGGPPHHYLERVRSHYALSLHGVGLSLGSTDPLNERHLHALKRLVARYQPAFVSDHLSWSSIGGRYLNDLLPLPYTEESLAHVSARIAAVQEFLGRELLIENPSTYLRFTHSTIPEGEFLAEVARRADCGILLDVNNVYVSAVNHGLDPRVWLDAVPADRVRELHLAGHTRRRYPDGEILIDTHDAPVCPAVWALYGQALARLGARPTLIEWDSNLPPFTTLLEEAARARRCLEACDALAA
ncbi:hypothetical protein SVA_1239 [Sulfurifustis variabilis]|uniref:UPF0276 protein SVA_1239 n=1 Tax=Sulfurifustis variabilis TaxID=1675686 RepID=A0A1B4V8P8_9GAMM|nr:DUF692 domain-containing protein [Sulfurifustis variabilis]BAU47814.1 hypothetical protein SVA_1239 [Sulfurifustis variabilis]